MGCATSAPQGTDVERFEVFDPEYISAQHNNQSIVRSRVGKYGFAKTAYGNVAMLCNGESSEIHHFTLKIEHCKPSQGFAIGIDRGRTQTKLGFTDTHYNGGWYAIDAKGHKRSESHKPKDKKHIIDGFRFVSGNIVEMEFDINQRTLSFGMNRGKLQNIFKVPTSETPYYLAVSLKNKGDKVTVLQYSCSGCSYSASSRSKPHKGSLQSNHESIHSSEYEHEARLQSTGLDVSSLEEEILRLRSRCDELETKVKRLEKEKKERISSHRRAIKLKNVEIDDALDRNKLLKIEIKHLSTSVAPETPPSYDKL